MASDHWLCSNSRELTIISATMGEIFGHREASTLAVNSTTSPSTIVVATQPLFSTCGFGLGSIMFGLFFDGVKPKAYRDEQAKGGGDVCRRPTEACE